MIGISQPHVHNVLKGVRNLSIGMSDSILNIFHLSILDLAPLEDLESKLKSRKALPVVEVPVLDKPIGPGIPWPAQIVQGKHFVTPVPTGVILPGLVMALVAPDPQMGETLAGYDIAILDTSERHRAKPSPEGLYAVERGGEVVLRYLRPGSRCYYLVSDATLGHPAQWEHLSISRRELFEIIKARVLWLGREKDRKLPMSQRGRFLYEVISS